jgi:hypothetical protein
VHTELLAVVQVRLEMHCGTGVHGRHTLGPLGAALLSSQYPAAHDVHCEFVADVQLSEDVQLATGLQTMHESASPSWRYVPPWHVVHCGWVASRHCPSTAQNGTWGQGKHCDAGPLLSR